MIPGMPWADKQTADFRQLRRVLSFSVPTGRWFRFSCVLSVVLLCAGTFADVVRSGPEEPWSVQRRGSWLARQGDADRVVLTPHPAAGESTRSLVIRVDDSASNVRQAARFLSQDMEKLTGAKPVLLIGNDAGASTGAPNILIRTDPQTVGSGWETYSIVAANTTGPQILIRGSDAHGTAFGVYELCERIGVDPLYLWTGYEPRPSLPLALKPIDYHQGSPAFQYRGLFHDDEDVLPRPKRPDGLPDFQGTVPMEWYERYFETALRLRMNMVAPWVRTIRRFDVQKTASEWGLYYTSHHYDILLSDPYHFDRGKLAEKRGVPAVYDYVSNREGLLRFWKGGVDENGGLHCIWPIGLRGTEDFGYKFPKDWTTEQKLAVFNDCLRAQADLVNNGLPAGEPSLLHFTMYNEMLPFYKTGRLHVPEQAMIIWTDDGDGIMRELPGRPEANATSSERARKHGVYYHLAFLGGDKSKQVHQTVPLARIEKEFRGIVDSGTTAFCLNNVTELREFVMGTRFIEDICWQGKHAFDKPDAAERFLNWWCTEYFGREAAPNAAECYRRYLDLMPYAWSLAYGADACLSATHALDLKYQARQSKAMPPETSASLAERRPGQEELEDLLAKASSEMPGPLSRQFFFENLELPAAIDRLNSRAGLELIAALAEPDITRSKQMALEALLPLDQLEALLRRGERWPFDGWYGPSAMKARNKVIVFPRRQLIELLTKHLSARAE